MAKGDSADCFFHTVQKIFGRVVAVNRLPESHAGSALHQGILQTVHGADVETV